MKGRGLFLFILLIAMSSLWDRVFAQQSGELMEEKFGSYTPNAGFRLVTTDKGVLNFKLFTYLRYLNQLGIDSSYTNTSGTTILDPRQDMQVNKVNIQFHGWFMDPRFKYLFYIWTNNTAQGQGAQVVVAGNLQYSFKEYLTVGGGINSLPGVRTTEGNFPFWLPVDNRLIADEYFRPSYTTGIWAKGNFLKKFAYQIMLGNNLSQLGIDAGQLDAGFNTLSTSLTWFPTTGEFGFNSNFGDFDNHQKVATRLGAHFTRSDEDRQGVPASEAFENVTIRISDGSVVFNTGIFGQGIRVDNVTYNMASFDAGVKYKGLSLDGEFYIRRVKNLEGVGTEALSFDELKDNGFQLLASGMVIEKTVQLYGAFSKINGEYGDPYDYRFGVNWYPWKNQVVRWNFEWMNTHNSPVGGLSLPMPVGANGNIFYSNFLVNF